MSAQTKSQPAATCPAEAIQKLSVSAHALAVVAGVLDARLSGQPLHPELAPHAADALAALGIDGGLDRMSPTEVTSCLYEIRSFWHLNTQLLHAQNWSTGWTLDDPDFLQEFGSFNLHLATAIKMRFAPELGDLSARLASESAAFLDIGSGVGALSIAMATAFPAVRVVGVDPFRPSMDRARRNVADAHLTDRIELREHGGEELTTTQAFDLAWIPSPFIPQSVLPGVVERVREALRPGGWVIYAQPKESPDPLAASLGRMRSLSFGGGLATVDGTLAMLDRNGYANARELPTPPTGVIALIAAQRPG